SDKEEQFALAQKIAQKGLSVRETEKLVKKLTEKTEEPEKDTKEEKTEDRLSLFFQDLEEQLKGIMGTKVQIRRKDEKKGRIEIEYYSPEELERITELLQSLQG
ncbi:MAG: chromosome partitioning protein ParB, partial [Clostridium sp.]|nr:chromosome partitioning protein ParB [Clostridium sp.]